MTQKNKNELLSCWCFTVLGVYFKCVPALHPISPAAAPSRTINWPLSGSWTRPVTVRRWQWFVVQDLVCLLMEPPTKRPSGTRTSPTSLLAQVSLTHPQRSTQIAPPTAFWGDGGTNAGGQWSVILQEHVELSLLKGSCYLCEISKSAGIMNNLIYYYWLFSFIFLCCKTLCCWWMRFVREIG